LCGYHDARTYTYKYKSWALGDVTKGLHIYIHAILVGGSQKHNIIRKNAIDEYLDYQIPVTQLKGPKGNGDMQAVKRD